MKILIFLAFILMISANTLQSDNKNNELQRLPVNVFDIQKNTKSNFAFHISNYGINFLNIPNNQGGGFWPRGSKNQYIFGGGFWLGAMKWVIRDSMRYDNGRYDTVRYRKLSKLVEVSYNPNSGASWMVPGRINDGHLLDESDIHKYRVYFSSDMNENGEPKNPADGPNWPLWKNDINIMSLIGNYVDIEARNHNSYPLGPAIYSDEDIFCTYKDTDLNYYEGGSALRKNRGYPLGLQYEQTIYSWADEEKKNMVVLFYKFYNTSNDTLSQCWFAPLLDIDLFADSLGTNGYLNDRSSYYNAEPYLNMSYAWTNTDKGELGKGFGYLGFTMILSPVIGSGGRTDNSKLFDSKYYPIGVRTFKNWSIFEDVQEDADRYDFISYNSYDGDNGPGDKRMLMASGPFEMYPGDTAMFAILINFALPAKGGEADGTKEDLINLVRKVKTGKDYFLSEMLTGILEKESNDNFKIYPNPSQDIIYLDYQPKSAMPLLKIYDLLGNEVFKGSPVSDGKYIIQNIEFLQNGTYIICIIDDKNVISNKLSVIK